MDKYYDNEQYDNQNFEHVPAPIIENNDQENDVVEHFEVTNSNKSGLVAYSAIHFLAFLFAIYLSFKCNGKFDLGSFIVAFFCPWIYIIWILATRKGFCFDNNI